MGNSGSLNSLPGYDEHYHHQNQTNFHPQHGQRYQDHHHNHHTPPQNWMPSYTREHSSREHSHPHQQTQQIKVLPDIPVKVNKLRSTNNGHILHAGGTISKNNLQRSKSISAPNYQQNNYQNGDDNIKSLPPRTAMVRSRTQTNIVVNHPHSKKPAPNEPPNVQITNGNKRFGSEPDLRITSSTETSEDSAIVVRPPSKPVAQSKILKGKNKKKAPTTPLEKIKTPEPEKSRIVAYSPLRKTNSDASSTLPSSLNDGQPSRKLRLFKTRAESKKTPTIIKLPEASDSKYNSKNAPPAPKPKNIVRKENELDKVMLKKPNPTSFFRREKTFDLSILTERNKNIENVPKIKPTLSPPIIHRKAMQVKPNSKPSAPAKPDVTRKQPQASSMTDFQKELKMATRRKSIAAFQEVKKPPPPLKTEPMKKEVVVEKEKEKTPVPPSPKLPPPKTSFYFGMTDKSNVEPEKPMLIVEAKIVETKDESSGDEMMDKNQLDVIDKFAASLLNGKKFNSSDSIASSDIEDRMPISYKLDDENDGTEISLKLRPTLPRKHFEIPRFSPAAAWRLLTTEDDFGKESNDWIQYIEKKTIVRSVEGAENTNNNNSNSNEDRIERIYREPVPGLQDNKSGDSGISGDGGLPDIPEPQLLASKTNTSPEPINNNWSSKIHLSPWTPQQDLEDDDDVTASSEEIPHIENDFSSKGHLFSLSLPRESHLSIYCGNQQDKVEKHVFNSLQKLRKSVSDAFTAESNIDNSANPIESSDNWFLSRLETSSYEKRQLSPAQQKDLKDHTSIGYLVSGKHLMYLPKDETKLLSIPIKNDHNNNDVIIEKSIENKENLQDPEPIDIDNFPIKLSRSRHHKFTFQSTIRQIEKRRVAEKLSREAELKEAQRLSELEAMRQVEEEFQKKRAREKASIRHQLRLFSLEENPDEPDGIPNDQERSDPDGDSSTAPASLPYQTSKGIYRKNQMDSEKLPRRMKPSVKKIVPSYDSDEEEADESTSSIGYIDTRTPYISRIIQQKSSKVGGGNMMKFK